MNLSIKKFNLIIVVLLIILALGLIVFGKFEFVSRSMAKPIASNNDSTYNFTFIADRNDVSALILNFTRDFYIKDADKKNVHLAISYKDTDGKEAKQEITIPFSKIAGGSQPFRIPLLKKCQDQLITVSITIDTTEPEKAMVFENQNHNPVPEINTAQRIVYQVKFSDLLKEISGTFSKDKKFEYLYLSLLSILTLCFLALLLFERKDQK